MITKFLLAFAGKDVNEEFGYNIESVFIRPETSDLFYDVTFIKIPKYNHPVDITEKDIPEIFKESVIKAIENITTYNYEFYYSYNNQTFKFKIIFEEMHFQKKKKFFSVDVQFNAYTNKLYQEIEQYIIESGSSGRTLHELNCKYLRNHKKKKEYLLERIKDSGKFLIVKIKGEFKKPKTVFIYHGITNES